MTTELLCSWSDKPVGTCPCGACEVLRVERSTAGLPVPCWRAELCTLPADHDGDCPEPRSAGQETAQQSAQRLVIIAHDIERRFKDGTLVAPLGVPNSIEAMRRILDRLDGNQGRVEVTASSHPREFVIIGADHASRMTCGKENVEPTRDGHAEAAPAPGYADQGQRATDAKDRAEGMAGVRVIDIPRPAEAPSDLRKLWDSALAEDLNECPRSADDPPGVDLNMLDRLISAASVGPWTARDKGVVQVSSSHLITCEGAPNGKADGNARFIAAARTYLPVLVEEVRRLRDLVHDLEGDAPRRESDPTSDCAAEMAIAIMFAEWVSRADVRQHWLRELCPNGIHSGDRGGCEFCGEGS